jgi:RNA polymerase sigma-70 factor (ECF subfamily)
LTKDHSQTAKLVAGVRRGEQKAGELLYRMFAPMALRSALVLTRGRMADAEDLAQEAFVTAFGKLDELREPAHFGAWLLRTLRNQGINRYHANLSRERALRKLSQREVAPAAGQPPDDPHSALDRRQRAALLGTVFDALGDDPIKEAAQLYYLEDLSCSEVAERQGVPKSTVTTRLDRFRNLLRRRLLKTIVKAYEKPDEVF